MMRNRSRGVSILEFSFSVGLLVPLLMGTSAVGLNLISSLQIMQLARDTGHMFASKTDFTAPANVEILKKVGEPLGLTTDKNTSKAVIILSRVRYVDTDTCVLGGSPLDGAGRPTACPNWQRWVFAQQLVLPVGSTMLTSKYGTPSSTIKDPTTGVIQPNNYISDGSALVNSGFTGINPYKVVQTPTGTNISGLPSGEVVYVAESAMRRYAMWPIGAGTIYARTFF